jgi:hypothetical protein
VPQILYEDKETSGTGSNGVVRKCGVLFSCIFSDAGRDNLYTTQWPTTIIIHIHKGYIRPLDQDGSIQSIPNFLSPNLLHL